MSSILRFTVALGLIGGGTIALAQMGQSASPPPRSALKVSGNPKMVPAGRYELDKPRASIIGQIDHLGLSRYIFRFRQFDAAFDYDPDKPEASALSVTIDPTSIDMGGDERWNREIAGNDYLKTQAFPAITFRSKSLVPTGPASAKVTGDFTMMGVSRPVTLAVIFNGQQRGINSQTYLGFSATTVIRRSEFGLTKYVGPVGDDIAVQIEAEFVKVK